MLIFDIIYFIQGTKLSMMYYNVLIYDLSPHKVLTQHLNNYPSYRKCINR